MLIYSCLVINLQINLLETNKIVVIAASLLSGWCLIRAYYHKFAYKYILIISGLSGFIYFNWITYGTAGQVISGEQAVAIFQNPAQLFNHATTDPSRDYQYSWTIHRLSLSKQRVVVGVSAYDFSTQTTYRPHYLTLATRGCTLGAFSPQAIKITSSGWLICDHHPPSLAHQALDFICQALRCPSSRAGAWAYASLFGDRSQMDPSTQSILRHFGLMHLSSVSGFHLSLMVVFIRIMLLMLIWIAGRFKQLISLGLRPVKYQSIMRPVSTWLIWCQHHRWLRASYIFMLTEACLLLGWLYLIAFRPSALRAFLCYLTIMGLRALHRQFNLLHILVISIWSFMLISPLDMWSFSSLLSWSAYGYIMIVVYRFIPPKPLDDLKQNHDELRQSSRVITWFSHWLPFIKMWLWCQLGLQWTSFLMIGETSWLGLLGNFIILPVLSLQLKLILGVSMGVVGLTFMGNPWLTWGEWLLHQLLHGTDFIFHGLEFISHAVFSYLPVMVTTNQLAPQLLTVAELMTIFTIFALMINVITVSSNMPNKPTRR